MNTPTFTSEQLAIIETSAKNLKIDAVAGSGKTTTLLAYAKERKTESILYLAYNRSIAQEILQKAQQQNITNLSVQTFHGLAFRYTNARALNLDSHLSEKKLASLYLYEIPQKDRLLYAWLLKELLFYYLNSSLRNIDEVLLDKYLEDAFVSKENMEFLLSKELFFLHLLKLVLKDMKEGRLNAVHDFYLKLFALKKPRFNYDAILVDEAQDMSGVMLEILKNQNCKKIFVGDSYQQIYSFRHAVNSLEGLNFNSFALTHSFRFGDNLAKEVCTKINKAYNLLDEKSRLKIIGLKKETLIKQDIMAKPLTIIARSNVSLFDSIVKYSLNQQFKVSFEGDFKGYSLLNPSVYSVYYLFKNKKDQVSDEFIKEFNSFYELKEFAKRTNHKSLLNSIEIVTKYGSGIFNIYKDINKSIVAKERADVIFTTTHKSKGQEYEHVKLLDNDFITLKKIKDQLKNPEVDYMRLKEEINIFYVASTRAKSSISFPLF